MKILRALILLFGISTTAQANNWEYNGSTFRLQSTGSNRTFRYETPRQGLPVAPGTVLFNGYKQGNFYSGTAYVFSAKCGAIGYPVNGPISPDQRSVTLEGNAPVRDENCRIVRREANALTFNFRDEVRQANNIVVMTIGKDTVGFHEDFLGRTFYVDVEAEGIEHDWYVLQDIFSMDNRIALPLRIGRATGMRNGYAWIRNGERFIVHDAQVLRSDTFSPDQYLLLGHEIGHHRCGHQTGSLMGKGNSWPRELEADRFAGFVARAYVSKGLGTFDDLMRAAARLNADTQGSATHPPQHMRLQAIREGYINGTPCLDRAVVPLSGEPRAIA